jgi:hypothetical protein
MVGRVITVTEMGKPAQKCKILREWKMTDGSTARQVEDVATGEKLTIVETAVLSTSVGAQGSNMVKSVASRIYHWGKSETAPAGTPMPPNETGTPAVAAKPAVPEKKSAEPVVTPPKQATTVKSAEPVVTPPKQTTAQNTAPASPYISSRTTGGSEKSTGVLPAPTTSATSQAKDSTQSNYQIARPVWNQTPAGSQNTEVAQAPTQPAQPSDWRKSWGKLPEGVKKDDTAKAPAKADSTATPVKTDLKPTVTKNDAAPKPQTDPLSDPTPYTKVAVDQKINEKMNLPKRDEKPVSLVKAPEPLPPLPPLPPLDKPAPMSPTPGVSAAAAAAMPAAPSMPTATPVVRVETISAVPVVAAPVVVAPVAAAPVAVSPAPVASRHSLRHDKAATSAMPAPEPVGRVIVQNNEMPMTASNTMDMQHLLRILHESIYPSQREWAADQLADCDWKQNAPIVDALVKCAKEDPAATVRAGCVRCLSRMHVDTVPVVMVVQSLKADPDPRVRTEVTEALATLAPGLPMQAETVIQPTKGE